MVKSITLTNAILAMSFMFMFGFFISYQYILFQQNSWRWEYSQYGNKDLKFLGNNFCQSMNYERLYEIQKVKDFYAVVSCAKINSTGGFIIKDFDVILNDKN